MECQVSLAVHVWVSHSEFIMKCNRNLALTPIYYNWYCYPQFCLQPVHMFVYPPAAYNHCSICKCMSCQSSRKFACRACQIFRIDSLEIKGIFFFAQTSKRKLKNLLSSSSVNVKMSSPRSILQQFINASSHGLPNAKGSSEQGLFVVPTNNPTLHASQQSCET